MLRKSSLVLTLAITFLTSSLPAHEFWLRPDHFTVAPNAPVNFTLNVGEGFSGEPRPFTSERVQFLRHISASGAEDWLSRVSPPPGAPALTTTFATAGTHLVAYDSQPSLITLDAEKFNAYLREDGLAHIAAAREKAGTAGQPGRERYRRCVKTLLRVGASGDATFSTPTGQRIELVPITDPFATSAQSPLRVQLLFDGHPLARTLVRAWHRSGDRLTTLDAHTDANGTATFTLPFAGAWMLSTVHMIPATNTPDLDWESFWCSLTFAVAAKS
jgi:hypothetical protein